MSKISYFPNCKSINQMLLATVQTLSIKIVSYSTHGSFAQHILPNVNVYKREPRNHVTISFPITSYPIFFFFFCIYFFYFFLGFIFLHSCKWLKITAVCQKVSHNWDNT